jgi:hypothetical protein
MKTVIHVNQHNIKANAKNTTGLMLPVLSAKTYQDNRYGQRMDIVGDNGEVLGTFIYSPNRPLPCGAKVWFETTKQVNVHKTLK